MAAAQHTAPGPSSPPGRLPTVQAPAAAAVPLSTPQHGTFYRCHCHRQLRSLPAVTDSLPSAPASWLHPSPCITQGPPQALGFAGCSPSNLHSTPMPVFQHYSSLLVPPPQTTKTNHQVNQASRLHVSIRNDLPYLILHQELLLQYELQRREHLGTNHEQITKQRRRSNIWPLCQRS